jgi:hypothetical protein
MKWIKIPMSLFLMAVMKKDAETQLTLVKATDELMKTITAWFRNKSAQMLFNT